MNPMKKMIPDLIGAAGVCLLVAGLYLQYGAGPALISGGSLLMLGGFLAGIKPKGGRA